MYIGVAGACGITGFCFLAVLLLLPQPKAAALVSPLPDDLEQRVAQEHFVLDRKTLDQYPPNEYFPATPSAIFQEQIDVTAQAYAVMERKSGQLLIEKNIHQELPIASITKIMTALVTLENTFLDMEVSVSSPAAGIGEASMGLTSGEAVPVEQLLYGLLLPSGNDAAETLAQGLFGGRTSFLYTMNRKAADLGMYDTFFYNPSGLDETTAQTSNFSTGLDLLALTNYAMKNEKFAEIVSTHYKDFPENPGKHKAYYLYNILQLDWAYPGVRGVKPGITDFAAETLVSYAELGGKQVIVVLLSSEQSRDDVIKIYDYIFAKLGVRTGR